MAEAAAPLSVQLVISAGGLAETDFADSLAGDVLVAPYAPQLELLGRAQAFVSHGGANSVMEAMWSGVPLLLIPVCNDQPVQAHFIQKAGAGLSLHLGSLSAAAIRARLEALLDPLGNCRASARRVQRSYRSHDGAREAARLIAAL